MTCFYRMVFLLSFSGLAWAQTDPAMRKPDGITHTAHKSTVEGVVGPRRPTVDLESKVDSYVEPFVRANMFSGVILIARTGKPVLMRAYGMANQELRVPNRPETRFHIASVSKPFTALAILLLQQQGKLKVTDRVSRFVPDFPNGDRTTIHQLLTHTSGIANINDLPQYPIWSVLPQTPGSLVEKFKNVPLNFEPGARYSYSNSNYNLLAYIIEKVSGKDYGEFLRLHIFAPLEMENTSHDDDPGKIVPDRASGYTPAGATGIANAAYVNWSSKVGNGSLYSTAGDLLKFDQALYTDSLLGQPQRDLMFTPQVDNAIGYGWFISRRNNRRVVRINGRSPGFTAEIHRYTDENVTVIVLSNNYSTASQNMIADVAGIFFGGDVEPANIPGAAKVPEGELKRYVGTYRFGSDFFVPNGTYTVLAASDHLTLAFDENNRFPLRPIGNQEFYDRMFGGKIRFESDGTGRYVLVWVAGPREFRAARIN